MIYKSNLSAVLNRLKVTLLSPQKQDELTREIATTIYASNLRRIHKEGRKLDEGPIGSYSTKPLYVNPKKSPKKFAPKTRKKKNPKTRYFEHGYREFRGFIGRPTDRMNLQLSGKLKTEFRMVPISNGWALGFIGKYGKDVSEGQEKKHGEIWGISERDSRNIDKIVNDFINAQVK